MYHRAGLFTPFAVEAYVFLLYLLTDKYEENVLDLTTNFFITFVRGYSGYEGIHHNWHHGNTWPAVLMSMVPLILDLVGPGSKTDYVSLISLSNLFTPESSKNLLVRLERSALLVYLVLIFCLGYYLYQALDTRLKPVKSTRLVDRDLQVLLMTLPGLLVLSLPFVRKFIMEVLRRTVIASQNNLSEYLVVAIKILVREAGALLIKMPTLFDVTLNLFGAVLVVSAAEGLNKRYEEYLSQNESTFFGVFKDGVIFAALLLELGCIPVITGLTRFKKLSHYTEALGKLFGTMVNPYDANGRLKAPSDNHFFLLMYILGIRFVLAVWNQAIIPLTALACATEKNKEARLRIYDYLRTYRNLAFMFSSPYPSKLLIEGIESEKEGSWIAAFTIKIFYDLLTSVVIYS